MNLISSYEYSSLPILRALEYIKTSDIINGVKQVETTVDFYLRKFFIFWSYFTNQN